MTVQENDIVVNDPCLCMIASLFYNFVSINYVMLNKLSLLLFNESFININAGKLIVQRKRKIEKK